MMRGRLRFGQFSFLLRGWQAWLYGAVIVAIWAIGGSWLGS